MHWWQTAFSSSPSSSSPSSKRHADGIAVNKTVLVRSEGPQAQGRRLVRTRKLRHLTDNDVRDIPRLSFSPTSQDQSPKATPQPLPRPELVLLLGRDAPALSRSLVSCPAGAPLPSPKEPSGRGGEERGNTNGNGVIPKSGSGSKSAFHDSLKSCEHDDTQGSRQKPQELSGFKRLIDNNITNLINSAPTSAFSSPGLSPLRGNVDVFSSHHISPLDINPGVGFSQIYPEKTALSVDSSPLHSPLVSPLRDARSPNRPTSPLHKKLSVEAPAVWRDNYAQSNCHPLPLPPPATSPSRPTSNPQFTPTQGLLPRKSQWQKGKLIGRGTFGSVYVATNRETGALCAMKEVELFPDDPKSAESIAQLEQEINVLSKLKHPNIVQYYGSEIIQDRFYIYLEYVHPGSINKYIHEHCGAITESVVRNFTRHILSGLAYLHSKKTIHRDIKGANLLVDANGVVKLADFGMAKHLAGPASYLSMKGSPYWMAPELLQSVTQKDTSPDLALAVDIWSLGCTIIEMLNGKPPWSEYEGAAAMYKVLKETPPIPETLSTEGKDLLRCCFHRDPADRPTASELLEHRFFKNSQQLDVPSCTRALNGMKLMDNAWSSREPPSHKVELLQSSDAHTSRGR
ncbi:Mitogen-activated protein kinase kinase kinase [Bertholletia excelsa]